MDIIEIEKDFERYKNKIGMQYPMIADQLLNYSDSKTFFRNLDAPHNTRLRKEFYNLFGYPKKLKEEDLTEPYRDRAMMANWLRFNDYPLKKVLELKDDVLFREYCLYSTVKDLDVDDLFSSTALQVKYLQAEDKDDLDKLTAQLKQIPDSSIFSDVQFLKLHKSAYNSKNSKKFLDDYEKNIKYTTDSYSDYFKIWKRTRSFVNEYLSAKTVSFEDMLMKYIPNMKFVSGDIAFPNKTKDEEALQELNKLISVLPYKKEADKLDVLNSINNYMDKDIVKMLPQFKDKWVNGRLCFEIGDEDRALFKPYKGVMNTKYFVITVNPVDLLFCSTDQEYQSCFSLLSPHGSVKGLPNFIARKDIAMCFLSSGSMSKPWKHEWYPGLSFSHVKIKARAFLYNDQDLKMIDVGRCYSPYEISNASKGSLNFFRSSARVLIWKLLFENNNDFNVKYNKINSKFLSYFLKKGEFMLETDMEINFEVAPLVERVFKKHEHNEVYFDNLNFTSSERYYYSEVGRGCTSRYNAHSDTLGSVYKMGLEELKQKGK